MKKIGVVLAVHGVPPSDWPQQNRALSEPMERQDHRISKGVRLRPSTPENDAFSAETEELAQRVKEKGGYDILEVGHNEFGGQSVAEAIEKVIAQGARRVIVVPTMFTKGGIQIEGDTSRTVTALQEEHPEVEIIYTQPPFDPNRQADLIISMIREHHKAYPRSDDDLGLIRLSALKKGETGTIYDFLAGHGLVSRLSALGFTPGAPATMVQNFGHGPVIVSIRDTRIALGRGEAEKVRVRRSDEEQ